MFTLSSHWLVFSCLNVLIAAIRNKRYTRRVFQIRSNLDKCVYEAI